MRTLINASTATKIGGDLTKNLNLIKALDVFSPSSFKFFVVTTDYRYYKELESEKVKIILLPAVFKKMPYRYFLDYLFIPKIIKTYLIHKVINLVHIPLPINIFQVALFTNALMTLDSKGLKNIGYNKPYLFKLKQILLRNRLKYVDKGIVQTAYMRDCFVKMYKFDKIDIIPNSFSLYDHFNYKRNINQINLRELCEDNCFIAFYPSRYYPHKNHNLLIELAIIIKQKNINLNIVTTVSPDHSKGAKRFLEKIEENGLGKVIKNIGAFHFKDIGMLYNGCDCIVYPSYIETHTPTFLDAHLYKKPVIAADLPYVTSSFGESFLLFNPNSVESLYCVLLSLMSRGDAYETLISNMGEFNVDGWEEIAKKYLQLLV